MNALKPKSKDFPASSFKLSRDEWNHIVVHDADGHEHRDVSVVPLFPISASKQWISLVGADGDEIVCFESLKGLEPTTIALLEEELALREFVPVIVKVINVSGTQEPCEWTVDTNHGRTSFVINAEEDVRRISNKSVVFTDANGIRFRVDDLKQLDSRSRSFVEWYI
jgi:hypothetical protein